ncbi:hypothetical protein QBA38_39625 [Streptomyces stelliscabiei]|uniref:hypothetical protein n=1 Tax=Streptomyces stelliscabiei TaxID=146820 RepID=UPI002FF0E140
MRSTETLLARKHYHHERQERIITEALADRWPDPERQQALRLVAMAGVGTKIWSSLERHGRRPTIWTRRSRQCNPS